MGGICGIVALVDSFDASEHTLASMCEVMSYRGPDGRRIESHARRRGCVTLGQLRFSLSGEHVRDINLAHNESGTVKCLLDGRIYNHAELRSELAAAGHIFASGDEAETVVHLYEHDGARFLERLDGIFALAIWDERDVGQLVLARDRLGIKPLYYSQLPGGVVFASEIKALLEHGGIGRELDEQAFSHYLTFTFTPAPLTMFAGVHKLAPAQHMIVRDGGIVETDTYWSPLSRSAVERARGCSEQELQTRLLELLRGAISKQAAHGVAQGVLLSGGVDSSTIAALLATQSRDPVRTYSVAYERHEHYNELEHAREIARRYATEHNEVLIREQDLVSALPQMIFHQDEPIADWVCMPLHHVAQLAREQHTLVAHIGEGSDELFIGSDCYIHAARNERLMWDPMRRLPGPLQNAMASAATGLARRVGRGEVHTLDVADVAAGRAPFWGTLGFRGELKERVLAAGAPSLPDSYEVACGHWQTLDRELPDADLLQRITYLELKQRVAELLLMRVDKMTVGASLEMRAPLLDAELVEFAIALPAHMKVRGRTGKWLLKKAVAGSLLPPRSVYRRKQGFDAPVAEWFREGLGRTVQRQIRESGLAERGLIDYDAVDRLWEAHRKGPVNWSAHLWLLYNVSAWYDHWIADRELAQAA